ncbi:MAG: helix-turn-helix domain-containing protein [Bacteroidota bacterium]
MSSEKKWLRRLHNILKNHLADVGFDNQQLAREFELSERHLSRKVKQLTGLSPQKYLRQYRLNSALDYLRNGTYTSVKETSLAIGYVNTSYFIKQFEKEFGQKPLNVLKEFGWR